MKLLEASQAENEKRDRKQVVEVDDQDQKQGYSNARKTVVNEVQEQDDQGKSPVPKGILKTGVSAPTKFEQIGTKPVFEFTQTATTAQT